MKYGLFLKISVILVFVIVIGYLLTKRFIFFKTKSKYINSLEDFVPHTFQDIFTMIYEPAHPEKTIIYLYDREGNISYYGRELNKIRDNSNARIVAFDYTGYGKSRGIPSENQSQTDTAVIVNFVQKNYDTHPENIILFGQGIGCSIALYTAFRFRIPKIIFYNYSAGMRPWISEKLGPMKFLSRFFSDFNPKNYRSSYMGEIYNLIDEKYRNIHTDLNGINVIGWDQIELKTTD